MILKKFQQRNKPKEPPKAPKLAPFFLPTVSNEKGFTFNTAIEEHQTNKKEVNQNLIN
jgi:U3 small nucleolar RNA-associated protein 21